MPLPTVYTYNTYACFYRHREAALCKGEVWRVIQMRQGLHSGDGEQRWRKRRRRRMRGRRRKESKKVVEATDDVPWINVLTPFPVNWILVCHLPSKPLKPSQYIDYKGLIMNERTPALFPKGSEGTCLPVVSTRFSIM